MAVVLRTEPVAFAEPTLGRLILGHPTIADLGKLSAFLRPDGDDDEVAANYLSLIARRVRDGTAPVTDLADVAPPIEPGAFAALSGAARDALAQACLDNWSVQINPPAAGEGPLADKRAVARLRRMLDETYVDPEASAKRLASTFARLGQSSAGIDAMLSRLKFPASATAAQLMGAGNGLGAFDRLKDQLREHAVLTPRIDMPKIPPPPPNPIYKTNEHLSEMRGDLDKLIEISGAQASVTQALANTASSSLRQTIGQGEETRTATRLARLSLYAAVGALAVAVIVSGFDVVARRGDEREAGRTVKALEAIAALQAGANAQFAALRRDLLAHDAAARLGPRLDALTRTQADIARAIAAMRGRHGRQGAAP